MNSSTIYVGNTTINIGVPLHSPSANAPSVRPPPPISPSASHHDIPAPPPSSTPTPPASTPPVYASSTPPPPSTNAHSVRPPPPPISPSASHDIPAPPPSSTPTPPAFTPPAHVPVEPIPSPNSPSASHSPLTPPLHTPPSLIHHSSRRGGLHSSGIGAVVAAAIVIIIVIAILWVLKCRKSKQRTTARRNSSSVNNVQFLSPSHVGPRIFSYQQLSLSTNNFCESELLGRGGFGPVYKGKLEDADGTSFVAVKCIAESSSQGDKEFKAEVTIIRNLRHRNLVKLKGWCYEHGKFLLVYDYMPNGSLDCLLFNDVLCERLTWERRYSIALGLGSALQYLHDECENLIIHRDIKSSNVLLDECYTAKLGDFGLSRQMDRGISSPITAMAGTRGYVAPECLVGFGKATRETDVYAFGIVLLELVSGKRALDARILEEHEGMLVDWVWHMQSQGRLMEVLDERLRGTYDREEGKRMVMVGLVCASPDAKARPKIRSALEALRGSVALPQLPLLKPMLTSFLSSPCTTRPNMRTCSSSTYLCTASSHLLIPR